MRKRTPLHGSNWIGQASHGWTARLRYTPTTEDYNIEKHVAWDHTALPADAWTGFPVGVIDSQTAEVSYRTTDAGADWALTSFKIPLLRSAAILLQQTYTPALVDDNDHWWWYEAAPWFYSLTLREPNYTNHSLSLDDHQHLYIGKPGGSAPTKAYLYVYRADGIGTEAGDVFAAMAATDPWTNPPWWHTNLVTIPF